VLSIEQIADRLDDPFNLLTGGSRTALPRHQTLLAAIDWSYNLLTEPERILFRRLSVFAGGWTLEAAERVCGGDGVDERSLLELLSGLVDKSLVLPEDRNEQQRYRFMVTLLEYAHKRLMQTDEGDTIHRRYAEFFVALATESESKLIGAEQQPWLARLNDEYDNIRTVLSWTSKHDVDMRLGFAGVLGRFWYLRGYLDEGRRWLAEVLATKGSNAQVEHRIKALNAAARIALHQGDWVSVGLFLDQALTLARESDNKRETADALNMLAILASEQDDFAAARSYLEETLLIRRQLGDKGWMALALNNLGVLAIRQADFSSALSRLDEALSLSREAGDPHGIATAMGNRAEVARRLGDYAMAQSLRAQGLAIAQDFGDKTVMVPAFGGLGNLARQQGDYARARLLLEEGLKLSRELGNKTAIADALQSIGLVAEDCADDATARSLFEQTVVIRRGLGEKLNMAVALNGLGRVMARVDDAAAARSFHEQALEIGKRSGARDSIAQSIIGLADLARRQADDALALSHYKQSLALWWELGETPELPHALENIGALVAARAQHERAARLWGAAEALRTAIGVPRPPSEADEYQRHVTAARAAFGKDAFKVAWAQGQAMAPSQAVAHALEEAGR
jgi:tetratricopeptide (TPR) repeat protein